MNRNLVLSQKIKKRRIAIEGAKSIQLLNVFHRQVTGRLLVAILIEGGKLQRVAFSRQTTGVKQVVSFFHGVLIFKYADEFDGLL